MTAPDTNTLFAALEATWPPARVIETATWRVRDGQRGGQRVSSAVALGNVSEPDIDMAEAEMRALNQHPLFMLRDRDAKLDQMLDQRGYAISDPTAIYWVDPTIIARTFRPGQVFPTWPSFAVQNEIWAEGGVGPERLQVMARAKDPKISILCRTADTPAASVFASIHQRIAMLHALEVTPNERLKGVGETAVRATAQWALDHGATWLALAVTKANSGAHALYAKLGFTPCASYHYRRAPKATA